MTGWEPVGPRGSGQGGALRCRVLLQQRVTAASRVKSTALRVLKQVLSPGRAGRGQSRAAMGEGGVETVGASLIESYVIGKETELTSRPGQEAASS